MHFPIDDFLCMGESINGIRNFTIQTINGKLVRILKKAIKIDISVFNRAMIRLIEVENWKDEYDPLAITDDESDDESYDDYLYD